MSDFKDKFTLGVRSWKMRIILVWTLFPGGWAMTGPSQVAANLGGSLAVSCGYKPGYELFPKYWCRSGFLQFCFSYMAQTNGSEVTVTQGRVSIRDNHKARSFIVILGGVTPEDEGWYSCGVKRRLWFDLRHTTKVMVSAVVSTTMEGRDVSPLTTNSLCPTACGEPPVWSQLGVTHLLVLLGVKVLMALALACGAAWVRSQRRNHNEENFQLFEHQQGTGLPTHPDHIGATEIHSCPLGQYPARAVPPLAAAPCQELLGSRFFSPCEASAPPDSPCTEEGMVWVEESLHLLS